MRVQDARIANPSPRPSGDSRKDKRGCCECEIFIKSKENLVIAKMTNNLPNDNIWNDVKLQKYVRAVYNSQVNQQSELTKCINTIRDRTDSELINRMYETLAEKGSAFWVVTCDRCGKCCGGEIAPILTLFDLSNWVDNKKHNIIKQLTIEAKGFPTIRQNMNEECVFYNASRGCSIYNDRPLDCRVYPGFYKNTETQNLCNCPCDEKCWNRIDLNVLKQISKAPNIFKWICGQLRLGCYWNINLTFMQEMIKEYQWFPWQLLMVIAKDFNLYDLKYRLAALRAKLF
jgi:Fe-S-cluster containining protein